MPKKKAKTVVVKSEEESPRVKEEEDEYDFLDVKQEPDDLDEEAEDYLEPTVTITQDDEADPVISVKVELEEEEEDTNIDMTECQPTQASGPFIDVSTISSNTPQMALSTVREATPVMGGFVSPWPLGQMINVHPTLFIRTTCSKIFLPPGLYTYER